MKTQKTAFRLSKLALVIGAASLSLSSHAVYNLYKKDGLTLDINGQLDVQATKNDSKITLLQDGIQTWDANFNEVVNKAGTELNATDKETRLNQNQGVSFIDFRGAQELPYDWRVTGNVGVGYTDARSLYLSNSSLSLDKKNVGAISLGRQYLHTNYVNRTGTDTPLDIFSTSALRLDYYGIKGLHASAYYSFTGSNDVRREDNTALDNGYGASLSYRFPFANSQALRFGAGYTESNFNPVNLAIPTDAQGNVTRNNFWLANANTMNQYPEKATGVAGSLEYQAGKLTVAADVGKKKETMLKNQYAPIDTRTTDYLGAKVAFDVTPVFKLTAGYGVKKAEAKLKDGVQLSNDVNGLFANGWANLMNYVDGAERNLYNKADTKELYVQADYRVRPNVRVYGRYDDETTTYQLNGADFSKAADKNVRAGLVFSF